MNASFTTTSDAASAESRMSTLPPVECAPWCEDGTGHTDAWHPADQYCRVQTDDIPLTAEELVEWDTGRWGFGDVTTSATREPYSTRPLINVSHNGNPPRSSSELLTRLALMVTCLRRTSRRTPPHSSSNRFKVARTSE